MNINTNVLRTHIQVLDEIICYGCLPLSALQQVVYTLSFVYYDRQEPNKAETALKIFRNLLGGQLGFSTMERLRCIFYQGGNCNNTRLCGAVSLITSGLFGSATGNTMSHMSHDILMSLQHCLSHGNVRLAFTVVTAVLSLIRNQGLELHAASWDEIVSITEVLAYSYMPICDATSAVEANSKKNELIYGFHELLTLIEKFLDSQAFHGDAGKLFRIVESVIEGRPESSLLLLLRHKSENVEHGHGWCADLYEIFKQFLDPTMNAKVQCKAIEITSKLFCENFAMYDHEIIETVTTGSRWTALVDEPGGDVVRDALIRMLFDLSAVAVEWHRKVKLFALLEPFFLVSLRLDLVSSVSLCVKYCTETAPCGRQELRLLLMFLNSYYGEKSAGAETLAAERLAAYDCLFANLELFTPAAAGNLNPELYLRPFELFSCLKTCMSEERHWRTLESVLQHFSLELLEQSDLVKHSNHTNHTMTFEELLEAMCKLFNDSARHNNPELQSTAGATTSVRDELQRRLAGILRGSCIHQNFISTPKQRLIMQTLFSGFMSKCSTLCISAVTLCLIEFNDEAVCRILPMLLFKLSQKSATVVHAPFVLEFLSTLSQMPLLYKSFSEAEYKEIFAVALSHTNTAKFSMYIVSLAQYVVCNWFVKCREQFKSEFVSHITRILQGVASKSDEKSVENLLVESCLDLMASYMYTNDLTNTSPNRHDHDDCTAGGNSITWLLGNRLVTISTEKSQGPPQAEPGSPVKSSNSDAAQQQQAKKDDFWATIEIRRPCGHTSWHIASNNIKSFLSNLAPAVAAAPPQAAATAVQPTTSPQPPPLENENEQMSRKRSSTISSANDYRNKHQQQQEEANQQQITCSPKHVFLQLFYTSLGNNPQNRPLIIPNSVRLSRTLKLLDMKPAYDTWSSGVCYVRANQHADQKAIVLNQHGTHKYQRFLSRLGNLICLQDCDERRCYLGGLDFRNGEDGVYTYVWQEKIMQMVFHVATLMPNRSDSDVTSKTLHIGNDYVLIVYDESDEGYVPHTVIRGQFLMLEIVVRPVRDIYSVRLVFHKPEVEQMLNMPPVRFVTERRLAFVVKQLCLYANMASKAWREHGRADQVTSKIMERLKHIRRVRTSTLDELSKQNQNAATRYEGSTRNTPDEFTDYV